MNPEDSKRLSSAGDQTLLDFVYKSFQYHIKTNFEVLKFYIKNFDRFSYETWEKLKDHTRNMYEELIKEKNKHLEDKFNDYYVKIYLLGAIPQSMMKLIYKFIKPKDGIYYEDWKSQIDRTDEIIILSSPFDNYPIARISPLCFDIRGWIMCLGPLKKNRDKIYNEIKNKKIDHKKILDFMRKKRDFIIQNTQIIKPMIKTMYKELLNLVIEDLDHRFEHEPKPSMELFDRKDIDFLMNHDITLELKNELFFNFNLNDEFFFKIWKGIFEKIETYLSKYENEFHQQQKNQKVEQLNIAFARQYGSFVDDTNLEDLIDDDTNLGDLIDKGIKVSVWEKKIGFNNRDSEESIGYIILLLDGLMKNQQLLPLDLHNLGEIGIKDSKIQNEYDIERIKVKLFNEMIKLLLPIFGQDEFENKHYSLIRQYEIYNKWFDIVWYRPKLIEKMKVLSKLTKKFEYGKFPQEINGYFYQSERKELREKITNFYKQKYYSPKW